MWNFASKERSSRDIYSRPLSAPAVQDEGSEAIDHEDNKRGQSISQDIQPNCQPEFSSAFFGDGE
jgi:hypothetical protein